MRRELGPRDGSGANHNGRDTVTQGGRPQTSDRGRRTDREPGTTIDITTLAHDDTTTSTVPFLSLTESSLLCSSTVRSLPVPLWNEDSRARFVVAGR